MKPGLRRLRRAVLPVRNPRGTIGTASIVADQLALAALHVVAPESPATLSVGGLPVRAVATLPLADYEGAQAPARRSHQRDQQLVSCQGCADLGTVDLALLAVPGLHGPPLHSRDTPVEVNENVVVPGYSGGQWGITRGPVVGVDDADFAVHLLLGPGASGAPVLDEDGHIVGVVTLDHESATICVGPRLLTTFLNRYLAVPK